MTTSTDIKQTLSWCHLINVSVCSLSVEMGVKGLQYFMERCCPESCVPVNLREMARQHVSKTTDNSSSCESIYKAHVYLQCVYEVTTHRQKCTCSRNVQDIFNVLFNVTANKVDLICQIQVHLMSKSTLLLIACVCWGPFSRAP